MERDKIIEDRGSGRTTEQMLAAPNGSWYVWCNNRLDYPRLLAANLRRNDLHIVSPGYFHDESCLQGSSRYIVVDHAVSYRENIWGFVLSHNSHVALARKSNGNDQESANKASHCGL